MALSHSENTLRFAILEGSLSLSWQPTT